MNNIKLLYIQDTSRLKWDSAVHVYNLSRYYKYVHITVFLKINRNKQLEYLEYDIERDIKQMAGSL